MSLIKITVFGLSLLMFALSCKKAGEEITVSGVVTDFITGDPLSGVSVASSDGATTTTGTNGEYSIATLTEETITFTYTDYSTKVELVSVDVINVELEFTSDKKASIFASYFANVGNSSEDPIFAANSIRPTAPAMAAAPPFAGFEAAFYKGAIDPVGTPWYTDWSFYDNLINQNTTSDAFTTGTIVNVNDASMTAAGMNINWTNNNTYVLDGFVFVNDGVTLNIEAGTIIQGKPGEGSDASALVVARGGKIEAVGSASQPIIFTYEGDNGGSSASLRGQWGGLIILGKASLNSSPGESAIEGLPTSETRGLYGGTNDADNSGILKYVSIRHGGTNIGADNEINGLTLGGVGSGTTIEYVEIIGNQDDGIEWFGGTVSAKYLIAAYCADDALDYDEGYRGGNQFVIVHQDPNDADRGGEHDGGTDPETGIPFATPVFVNVTSIGVPGSRAITFRDNAGGEYHNSIFTGYSKGIDIEDLRGSQQDSYKQWVDGNLKLTNNVFHNIIDGTTGEDLFIIKN